jgi:hypothetical protein
MITMERIGLQKNLIYRRLDQISMSWNRNLGPTKVQLASKGLLFVYKLSFIIVYAITPSKLKALIDE